MRIGIEVAGFIVTFVAVIVAASKFFDTEDCGHYSIWVCREIGCPNADRKIV